MESIDLDSFMSEMELRELSKALGSLIPKNREILDEEAYLYGSLISLALAAAHFRKEI